MERIASVFPSLEDTRIDDLVDLTQRLFKLNSIHYFPDHDVYPSQFELKMDEVGFVMHFITRCST